MIDGKLQVKVKKILKPKMVRMVHMNIFYRIDLKICDSKSEFLTKTEFLGLQKIENSVLGPKMDFLRLNLSPIRFLNIF